jgi:hypothetical protein
VNVLAQNRAWFAQAVAKNGPLLVETVEDLLDGLCVDVESARQAGEEGRKRGWEIELCHG